MEYLGYGLLIFSVIVFFKPDKIVMPTIPLGIGWSSDGDNNFISTKNIIGTLDWEADNRIGWSWEDEL